jgi:hypothetical protein
MRTAFRLLYWLAVALVAAAGAFAWLTRPAQPDAFYTPTALATDQPGQLLRVEPFQRGVPAGAQAWRMLYTTTRTDATSTVASALVVVAPTTTPGPRPVWAWTHGTTGFSNGCAPSLLEDPFAHVPALPDMLAQGWAYVATDYAGLGTPGAQPYLIGEGQARSALDAVRASRQLPGLSLSSRTVVWGHSQGGHAALWTGALAPTYAPDLDLAGVAALAPASDLPTLMGAVQHGLVGRIMTAYLLRAYSATYSDVDFDAYTAGWNRPWVKSLSSRCLEGLSALVPVAQAAVLGRSIFVKDPTAGPLGERLRENTPNRPVAAPLLIAQGLADDLVLPTVQDSYMRSRCEAGQSLTYLRAVGRDHLSLVAHDSPLGPELVRWSAARLADAPVKPGCETRSLPAAKTLPSP